MPPWTTLLALPLLASGADAGAPRDERLQDTPTSVSALSAEDIDSLPTASRDLAQLVGITPGVVSGDASKVRGLGVSVFNQTQYMINKRDDAGLGDDDLSLGFSLPVTEITLAGLATDSLGGVISLVTRPSSGGDIELENALVNWSISDDLLLLGGQFKPSLHRSDMVHESQLGGPIVSMNKVFFSTGYQQGLQLGSTRREDNRFAWSAHFTDGPDTLNSPFDSANEYDISLGGRLDFKPLGAWGQFTDYQAFRGTERGLLLGLGAWAAWGGDTNPSSVNDVTVCGLAADAGYEDDGWRINATFDWFREDTDGQPTYDFYGWSVEGGVFVSDQTELFARIEQILVDDDLALPEDAFLFAAFGASYFPIPESNAVRISGQIGFAFDPVAGKTGLGVTSTPVIGTNSPTGFLSSNEDGQAVFVIQLQTIF